MVKLLITLNVANKIIEFFVCPWIAGVAMFQLRRAEGQLVKNESTLRRLMPYIMPRRNDSVVYFEQQIDVTQVLAYLEKHQTSDGEKSLTFFHVMLTGIMRAAYQWPKMNRFISGGKIYQRQKVTMSFAVKKKMHQDAGMTAVKVEFDKGDTIFDVAKKINQEIETGRGKKLTTSEKEMTLVKFLPGFMIRMILWLLRTLDGFNLLPAAMTKNDPLYTGIFIANIGSVGLQAPFHHLFEHGTAPLFGTIGRIHKAPVVNEAGEVVAKDVVLIRWSFDERIADGFYCAQALSLFERFMQNPACLETTESEISTDYQPIPMVKVPNISPGALT